MKIIEQVLADKLFIQTGIESHDLDEATERLKLEEDADFQLMVKDYTDQVNAIQLGVNWTNSLGRKHCQTLF